jgi:predicted metal-dependent HD superfamily phosphohydrolase
MTAINQLLLQQAEDFVKKLFDTKVDPSFHFHNIEHTRGVVKASQKIGMHYQLDDGDMVSLLLASWFHDTGYSKGSGTDHEKISQEIATKFLTDHNVPETIIEKVTGCIAATRMPQQPTTLIEEIICDADLYHLGNDDAESHSKLLRKELNKVLNMEISKKDWRKTNIIFLQKHHYFTDYGKQNLEPSKQIYLNKLIAKNEAEDAEEPESKKINIERAKNIENDDQTDEDILKEKSKKDRLKDSRTERGIATMFRIMSANHMELSQMADSKANIMISVNTIVLSIMVSVLFNKLQFYTQFIIPSIILATVCLAAVVFAILATRPNVNRGTFMPEDIQEKKVNLLFFGNFFNMPLPDYEWAMKEMMNDSDYLYGSMVKDIYFLGVVLARKYKYLRISYNIFMFGLIIAVIAFSIASMYPSD